jgi:hypothetical protein
VGRGALASDPPVQDDIVGTMLVWAIDIGDWPLALELGDHVLAANLGPPERYKRSPAVLLAEEIAESALRVATAVPRAVLEETLALTADHDMPDQVRAKLTRLWASPSRPRPRPSIPRPKASARAASARWSMPRSTTPPARSCSTSTRA